MATPTGEHGVQRPDAEVERLAYSLARHGVGNGAGDVHSDRGPSNGAPIVDGISRIVHHPTDQALTDIEPGSLTRGLHSVACRDAFHGTDRHEDHRLRPDRHHFGGNAGVPDEHQVAYGCRNPRCFDLQSHHAGDQRHPTGGLVPVQQRGPWGDRVNGHRCPSSSQLRARG